MADTAKDISIEQLPEPISREDALLHNIIDGTPDITELEPLSREEVYLKYIALNGGGSGGGGGSNVNIVQTTGQSTTSVMSQKAVTDNLNNKVNIVDGKGLSTEDFTTEYKEKLDSIPNNLDNLGTAAYCDTGTEEGNVPVINSAGKLDNSVIPSLAITDTFVAENEEEMLNLQGAEKGDICIRTDENKTYILDETPSRYRMSTTRTSLSDWIELQTPTDEVQSVNGQKGNVVLSAGDVDAYTKEEIDAKVPNIVQEKGTSTTDVMSQKAVTNNTCFGEGAVTKDKYCASYGYNSQAIGNYSTAVGPLSQTTGGDSVALGYLAKTNNHGVACGNQAKANADFSVALGYNSKAEEDSVVSVGDGGTNQYFNTRRIVNVKDPVNNQDAATKNYVDTKTASSKITVVQSTGTSTASVMSQKAVSENTCFGEGAVATSTTPSNTVVIGKSASIGSNGSFGVSIGYSAKANNVAGVSLGSNTYATGANATSIGAFSQSGGIQCVSLGYNATANMPYSISLGSYSKTTENSTVSVGSGDTEDTDYCTRRIVNVSDPVNEQDAATKKYVDTKVSEAGSGSSVTVVQTTGTSEEDVMSQKAVTNNTCFGEGASSENSGVAIGSQTISSASSSVAIGSKAQATYAGALAIGENTKATVSGACAFGGRSNASGTQSLTLGSMSKANANYSVALGFNSTSNEEYTVSVGNSSTTRRIVNVGDPINDQDAVTKKFLDDTLSSKLEKVSFTGTISTTNWQIVSIGINGVSTPYYIQEVNIPGIKETDEPIISVTMPAIINDMYLIMDSWYCISKIITKEGGIWVTALNGKPTEDLDISLICFR